MIIGIERSDGGLSVRTLHSSLTIDDVPGEIARWEADHAKPMQLPNGEWLGPWTCVRWQVLDAHPPRENRNAYELGDGCCVLNPDKVPPAVVDPLADIKSRLAALEASPRESGDKR